MTNIPPPDQPQFTNAKDVKAQAKANKAYAKAQRPWFKKKRFILPLVIILLIVIISVSSGGSDDDTATDSTAATTTTTPDTLPPFPGAKSKDKVVQAGETVDADGVQITAGALKTGDSTLGATLCSPVKYVNNTKKSTSFNGAFDWKVQDPNGVILSNTFSGSDNILSSGQLAPGGNLDADVCFDAKNAVKGQYVILLDPTFRFSSDRIAWISKR